MRWSARSGRPDWLWALVWPRTPRTSGVLFLLERALVIAWACPGRSSVLPRATGHARLVVLVLEGVVKHKGQSGLIKFPCNGKERSAVSYPDDALSGISWMALPPELFILIPWVNIISFQKNCHRPSGSVVLFSTQARDVGGTSASTSGSRRSSWGQLIYCSGIRRYPMVVRRGLFFIGRRRHPRASLGTPPMGFPNSSCGRPKVTFGSRGRRRDAQRIVASLLGARRPGLGWSRARPRLASWRQLPPHLCGDDHWLVESIAQWSPV